jgi:hypothetical protein
MSLWDDDVISPEVTRVGTKAANSGNSPTFSPSDHRHSLDRDTISKLVNKYATLPTSAQLGALGVGGGAGSVEIDFEGTVAYQESDDLFYAYKAGSWSKLSLSIGDEFLNIISSGNILALGTLTGASINSILVRRVDNVSEGGQIDFQGAGAFGQTSIDNWQGNQRFFAAAGAGHFFYNPTRLLPGGEALRIDNDSAYIAWYSTGGVRRGYMQNANANGLTIGVDIGRLNISGELWGATLIKTTGANGGFFINDRDGVSGDAAFYKQSDITRLYDDVGGDKIYFTAADVGLNGLKGIGSVAGYQAVYWGVTFADLMRFTSSERFKENIHPVENSGAIIDSLRPVSFTLKVTEDDTEVSAGWKRVDVQRGFIAEEVAEIADGQLATYDVDGDDLTPISWRFPDLIAVAVAEIKALRLRVQALEAA